MKQVKLVDKKTGKWNIVKYSFPFERLVANLKNNASWNSKDPLYRWVAKVGFDNLKFEHQDNAPDFSFCCHLNRNTRSQAPSQ